jgi:hypothetical protein
MINMLAHKVLVIHQISFSKKGVKKLYEVGTIYHFKLLSLHFNIVLAYMKL